MSTEEILLVYDKECPACSNYCRVVRIRDSLGELKIVNARENSDVMEEITAKKLDIDQGMVLKLGGQLYYGSDALHALALISSKSGFFNRINYWIFKSQKVSALLYPILRLGRNCLLKVLGKTRINNLNQNDDENV